MSASTLPHATSERRTEQTLWTRIGRARWCYFFAAPALVLACLFTFYPTVMSWYYSMLDWNGFTADSDFVGLANYRRLLGDQYFWSAFGRSFLFVAVAVPIRMLLSLIVAIILNNQSFKIAPFYRTMFFLPVVTSAAVVGVVMSSVMSPFHGPINTLLSQLHLTSGPIDFLGNPHTALWSVIAVQIWKDFGITMIYWLAALQTVPRSTYEAAETDGAGRVALFTQITIPLLLPFAAIILLLTANNTLHVFAIVQSMTAGGPYFSSQVIETYIYQTAFAPTDPEIAPQLGYASAAGCFFGLATMIIALLQVMVGRAIGIRRSNPPSGVSR